MPRPCALIAVLLFATALPAAALWEPAASPPGDPIDFLHPAGPELFCTSYLGKVYVTTDHAESWTEVSRLTWDGADQSGRALPSGTYLLRLEAGGRVLARQTATLVR